MSEQSLASRTGWLDLAAATGGPALAWSGAARPCCPSWWPREPVGTAHDRWDVPGWPAPPSPWPATITRPRPSAPTPPGHAPSWIPAAPPRHSCARCRRGCAPDNIAALTDAEITVGWHALAEHWCLLGATRGGLVLQRVLALLGGDRR